MLNLVVLTAFSIQAIVGSIQGAGSGSQHGGGSTASAGSIMDRSISLDMTNAPVANMLDEIARKARTEINYARDIVQKAPRVTIVRDNITVRDALSSALRNTGLVGAMYEGKIAVVENPRASRLVGQGVISGKVTDLKTGRGIAGARISIGGETRGAISGEDGSYRLSGAPTGTHVVTVRLVGYAKQSVTVTVGEGAAVVADFKLEPSASVLDQVIVTGTVIATELKAVPNAVTVVTAKQIEERGITKIDQLFRGDIPGLFSANLGAVALIDSVAMSSRGASSIVGADGSTRGGAVRQSIKTYVDGVELANASYLNQIDPKSIERIEILTGPQASTIYGSNAINGVMQIFTKRGQGGRPQVTVNLLSGVVQNNFRSSLTPQHDYSGQLAGAEGRLGYSVGASWNYIGPWTPAKQTARSGVYGSGRLQAGKFTMTPSVRYGITRNKSTGPRAQKDRDFAEKGFAAPNLSTTNFGRTTSTLYGQTFGLNLEYVPLSWWSHELMVGVDASNSTGYKRIPTYESLSDTLLSVEENRSARASQRYTTTLQSPVGPFARLTATFGADHWRTNGSIFTARPVALTGSLVNPTISRSKPGKNTGGFVQGQLGIVDALFFTYGMRAEWNPNYGADAQPNLVPRYGVAYTRDISAVTMKLRASYGRSTRPPAESQKLAVPNTNATNLARYGVYDTQIANGELGPEFQRGGEGGLELYLGNRGSLVVTRYNQTVDALISSIPRIDSVRSLELGGTGPGITSTCTVVDDGYCYVAQSQYLNVGSIRNQGWELQGSINTGPFTTRGTYSWTKSRVLGVAANVRSKLTASVYQPGATFDFVPEHTWALGLSYSQSATSMSLNINGTGFISLLQDEVWFAVMYPRLTNVKMRIGLPTGYRPNRPGYTMSNFNAQQKLGSAVDAVLQIQNLTNVYQNDYNPAYTAIGRQTKAGLRIRM